MNLNTSIAGGGGYGTVPNEHVNLLRDLAAVSVGDDHSDRRVSDEVREDRCGTHGGALGLSTGTAANFATGVRVCEGEAVTGGVVHVKGRNGKDERSFLANDDVAFGVQLKGGDHGKVVDDINDHGHVVVAGS